VDCVTCNYICTTKWYKDKLITSMLITLIVQEIIVIAIYVKLIEFVYYYFNLKVVLKTKPNKYCFIDPESNKCKMKSNNGLPEKFK